MYFKTGQGQIRLTENCNHGIVMTVDDDDSQSKASMSIETAKRFAKELNTIIEKVEHKPIFEKTDDEDCHDK